MPPVFRGCPHRTHRRTLSNPWKFQRSRPTEGRCRSVCLMHQERPDWPEQRGVDCHDAEPFCPASVVIVLALAASLPVAAQVTLPIRMRTFAVNMSNNLTGPAEPASSRSPWTGGPRRAGARRRSSRPCPRDRTILVRALQKAPAKGRINIPGWSGPPPPELPPRLGSPLRVARTDCPTAGERIVARHRSPNELPANVANNPRTTDYPFLLIRDSPEGRQG